jgi:CheY-like chemotaxis protein
LRTDPSIHLGGSPALEFFVRDTGPGIPEDRIARIFEPFEQADSSTSRRYGGTGLGLTISRRLAVLMGGTLTVQSQEGKGAEFFFRLPLKAIDGNHSRTVTLPPGPIIDTSFALANPLRILVVEDDRVNLKLILTMIRKFGYQPVAARNGIESTEAFRRQPFDCVLMDLQMPGMDGIEATRQIREIERNFRMPATFISALTANTVPKDQSRCFDAGMNDYLNKPIKHEQLAQLLTKASAHKKQTRT